MLDALLNLLTMFVVGPIRAAWDAPLWVNLLWVGLLVGLGVAVARKRR